MNNPTVSVIIPTYNRPDTLARAIESVRNQTYEAIEIIIVDDNNPSDEYRVRTEKVMMNYKEYTNIKYIKHPKNLNGSTARNTGIKNSSGLYIAFLDDDDEFLPDKIENQVRKMESLDDSWGACYTNYLKKQGQKLLQKGSEKREGYLKKDALMRNLYIYAGSNLLIRRKVIERIGGFNEQFTRNQDLEFLVRILEHFKIAYVDSCSLIIQYDSRVTKPTFTDIEKINTLFIKSFQYHIDSLSSREKRDFFLMIDLDTIKNLILRKKINYAIQYIWKKKINIIIVARFMYYLVKRKLTNKCYGFEISKIV